MPPITIHGNTIDPDNVEPGYLPPDASNTNFILLQAHRPLSREDASELTARGIQIQQLKEGENTYLCRYEPSDLSSIEALPFVHKVIVYHPSFVIDPLLKADHLERPGSGVKVKDSGNADGMLDTRTFLHLDHPYDCTRTLR